MAISVDIVVLRVLAVKLSGSQFLKQSKLQRRQRKFYLLTTLPG